MNKKFVAALFAITLSLSMFQASAHTLGKQPDAYRTGLRAPTEREAKLFKEKAKTVYKILPNADGLKRINEARGQKGLKPFPSTYAVENGEEIISTKDKNTKAGKKYSA